MEFEWIVDHLKDKSILITGSTVFLGKVFVEKILRVQPNVKKLFLLVRAKDAESAMQRLQSETACQKEILDNFQYMLFDALPIQSIKLGDEAIRSWGLDRVIEKELFTLLKEEHAQEFHSFISEKVSPIAGDIVHENFGIQDIHLKELLWNEIDFVVNIAATTKFYDRYDIALSINTFGARNILEFAKKCVNLQRFLHVSTAFVSGNKKSGLIPENHCRLGETIRNNAVLDIEVEGRWVEERKKELHADNSTKDAEKVAMKKLGLMRAKHFGWPNTYAFTKAMGEMLLGQSKGTTLVSIVRPTIVTSIFRDPLPGWIEGTRTVDSFISAYDKGQLPCIVMDGKLVIDLIPGDMVVNAMIVTMITHSDESSDSIYHISSSRSNPVTYSDLVQSVYHYYDKNLHRNKMQKPIILKSMACFRGYMTARYGLPLKALWLMNSAPCCSFSDRYTQFNHKYKSTMLLVDLYKPYIFFKGIYDDSNMNKLRLANVENKIEGNLLDFDPKNIEWDEYITNIHVPGLLKYAGN